MAKGKSRKRGGFRRARGKIARASTSRLGRWAIFGLGLAGVLGVGTGLANVTGFNEGWKKGLVFVGVGLLGATAARMLGARRLSMPLQTAGIGLGVAMALEKQVDAVATKTASLGNASFSSGSMLGRPTFVDTRPVLAGPSQQAVNVARPSTLETVAGLAPSLLNLAGQIASAIRSGGSATAQTGASSRVSEMAVDAAMGIDDWNIHGANGLDDWESGAGLRGAGMISARDYAMVGNR